MEPLLVAGALAGGVGLAGLAVFAAWRYTRPTQAKAAEPVTMEIVEDHPATYVRAPPPASAPAPAQARGAPRPASPPPPTSPRSHAERAPAMVLTAGVAMQDEAFSRRAPARAAPAPAAAPAPPPRRAPPMRSWAQEVRETIQPEVPTEWARRQVGPVEPGRVAGACGGCGARLSVSDARPLRIACPVCGRTKLIA